MKKNAHSGTRLSHTRETRSHALREEFRRKRCLSADWIPNRKPIAHLVALALGAGLAHPAAAQIVPNGRTATTVTANGVVTDVHTATTRGVNAFNAFSQFVVNNGHIANLHLPAGTQNLINLVDSKAQIHGTLNSLYASGKIGGNVFFASPQGFVVGEGGVVNVGKLTVSTPTAAFMNQLIDAGGNISDAAVDRLLSGNAPQSPEGLITIRGKVNAPGGIALQGAQVTVDAGAHLVSGDAAAAAIAVNLGDGAEVEMVESGGAIHIVSKGDIDIAGSLRADGVGGGSSGGILVTAQNDVRLSGARLDATASGEDADGGGILVWGDRNARAEDTVLVSRGRGQGGAGGFIELSADKQVTVRNITVDTASERGQHGHFLIDPDELVIEQSVYKHGGDATFTADEKITILGDVVINTRQVEEDADPDSLATASTGDSGNITIKAPNIDIQAGARLLSFVEEGSEFKAGDIVLEAVHKDEQAFGLANASAGIKVAGTLHGGNITIKSDAQAITEWTSVEGIVTTALDTILGMAAGFNVGLVDANANSAVTIANGANIVASGDVNITSSSTRTATSIQATFLAVTPGQLAAVYGELTGEAKAEIASGASIKAGGALNVQASSENTLDVSAYSFSDNSGSYFSTTLASGHVDVETSAEIAQGANIDAGSLSLKAKDENDFAVTAGAWANGNGVVGLAVAVSEIDTAVSATLGADVEAAGAISVIADSATSKNRSSSAATTGDGIASKVVFGALDAAGAAASWAAGKSNQASDRANQKAGSTSGSPVKLGSSVSVNITEQDATAAIADDAVLNTGGDVAVLARLDASGIRNNATAAVESTMQDGDAEFAASAAVAVGFYDLDAEATIGDDAHVTGNRVGVGADVRLPITEEWTKLEDFSSIIGKISPNLGIVNQILTSFASATANTSELGLAGSVNIFDVDNDARAWIADGAKITTLDAGATKTWTTEIDGANDKWTWKDTLAVSATTLTESLNVGGNLNFIPNPGMGGGDDATTVGGAFNWGNYDNSAVAGIGAAQIVAAGVRVDAHSDDKVISVSPTSGQGGNIAGNGIVAMTTIDNTVSASISHDATVTADRVSLDAAQGMEVWTAAGALAAAEGAGVGIAIAVNDIDTDTRAYIGDNRDVDETDKKTEGTGSVTTDELEVKAVTDGQAGALAAAGGVASSSDPADNEPGFFTKLKDGVTNGVNSLRNSAANKMQNVWGLNKLAGVLRVKEGTPDPNGGMEKLPTEPQFGIGVSGSSTVNLTDMDTRAYVEGTTVKRRDAAGQTDVTVRALTDTDFYSISGARALARANNPSSNFSVGVAGTVAFNQLENSTYAGIRHSTIEHAGDVDVQALSSGDAISAGLGLAINASADQEKAGSAAGSVSLTMTVNETRAELLDTDITGADGGSVEVTAYDRSRIATGGGTVNSGGKYGVGGDQLLTGGERDCRDDRQREDQRCR